MMKETLVSDLDNNRRDFRVRREGKKEDDRVSPGDRKTEKL